MWSEIGGLWAASLFVMTFLFVSSGYTSVPHGGREVMQFRFLPNSFRSRWLDDYKKEDEVLQKEIDATKKGQSASEMEDDDDLEGRLTKLEKANADMRKRLESIASGAE